MIGNKLKKYNTAAYAQRQAKHIDKGVKLMLPKVTPGYLKVVFYHIKYFYTMIRKTL
ncbi:hypothetical protein GCM10011500_05480 [Mucilaginibacter rubeus]|nr:hypothetical protein GCM10011500_05480 [Mucilaginibacter rubeus]